MPPLGAREILAAVGAFAATFGLRSVLADGLRSGLDTITLQATEQGERLYAQLGLRRLGSMELWEHRRY